MVWTKLGLIHRKVLGTYKYTLETTRWLLSCKWHLSPWKHWVYVIPLQLSVCQEAPGGCRAGHNAEASVPLQPRLPPTCPDFIASWHCQQPHHWCKRSKLLLSAAAHLRWFCCSFATLLLSFTPCGCHADAVSRFDFSLRPPTHFNHASVAQLPLAYVFSSTVSWPLGWYLLDCGALLTPILLTMTNSGALVSFTESHPWIVHPRMWIYERFQSMRTVFTGKWYIC